jgi:hypothetical protein
MLLIGAQAIAAVPAWKVSEVSGDVRLSEAGRTRAAAKGALLGSGATIMTAPGARAVIVRGQEFVVISPGTRIRVPEANSPNKIMQLIADWGSALFKIEKKSTPHFGVQTPYLAAVVKGTTFTVTVGPEDAKVKVTEGAVEVSTLDGGASDLVRAGSLAMVGKSDLYRLTVQGEGAKELRSGAAPAAGAVTTRVAPNEASAAKGDNRSARAEAVRIARTIGERPVSLAKLTGGLVEGASAAEHAQGQFNENSRNARGPKPGKGDTDEQEKPGKDEMPAKDDKPAKEGNKPGEEEEPGKGEKPGADDKPAREDEPAKDERPAKDDKEDGGRKPADDSGRPDKADDKGQSVEKGDKGSDEESDDAEDEKDEDGGGRGDDEGDDRGEGDDGGDDDDDDDSDNDDDARV